MSRPADPPAEVPADVPLLAVGPVARLPFRVGHGYDLHRLQPGGRLVLAGVVVAADVSPVAHSDGDVVIHAAVDALLGAMGWGDIGEHFSDADPRWKGAASRVFLETVYRHVRAAGYALANLDLTIQAERPKLKPFKSDMARALTRMLAGPGATTFTGPQRGAAGGEFGGEFGGELAGGSCVNIKAGTNEGCDAVGRGEAIAAYAVALLAWANPLESGALVTS